MDECDSQPSVVATARAWLRHALAAGPRPARELRQEAAARKLEGARHPRSLALDPR